MTTIIDFENVFDQKQAKRYVGVEYLFDALRWIFFLLALTSSFKHVQWAFALLESIDSDFGMFSTYLAAAAIEAVIALLAFQRQRDKMKERAQLAISGAKEKAETPTWREWMPSLNTGGLIFFMAISTIANVLHGYATTLEKRMMGFEFDNLRQLGALDHIAVITFAATLPTVVFYLGESVKIPGEDGVLTKLVEFVTNAKPIFDQLQTERDQLQTTVDRLQPANVKLNAKVDQLQAERDQFEAERDHAESRVVENQGAASKLQTERDQLQTTVDRLQPANAKLSAEVDQLQAERDQLQTTVEQLMAAAKFYDGANLFVRDVVEYHMTADGNRPSQQTLAKKWGLSKGVMNSVLVRANGYEPNEV